MDKAVKSQESGERGKERKAKKQDKNPDTKLQTQKATRTGLMLLQLYRKTL